MDRAAAQPLVMHAKHLLSGPTSLQVAGVIDRTTAPLLEERLRQEARTCHIGTVIGCVIQCRSPG